MVLLVGWERSAKAAPRKMSGTVQGGRQRIKKCADVMKPRVSGAMRLSTSAGSLRAINRRANAELSCKSTCKAAPVRFGIDC